MYPIVLLLHGMWRWVVIAAGVAAISSALLGLEQGRSWQPRAARMGRLFGIALDVQVLIGAVLYLVFSPLTTVALAGGTRSGELRYFAAIHPALMVAALILVHGAGALIKQARNDAARHRRAAWLYGATLAIVLGATPWWRPLLRF